MYCAGLFSSDTLCSIVSVHNVYLVFFKEFSVPANAVFGGKLLQLFITLLVKRMLYFVSKVFLMNSKRESAFHQNFFHLFMVPVSVYLSDLVLSTCQSIFFSRENASRTSKVEQPQGVRRIAKQQNK